VTRLLILLVRGWQTGPSAILPPSSAPTAAPGKRSTLTTVASVTEVKCRSLLM